MKRYLALKQIARITFLTFVILTSTVTISHYGDAATKGGTESDPIVTKSYVDKQISSLKTDIDSLTKEVSSLKTQLKKVKDGKYITVKKGKTLIMKTGCQVIVYSGSMTMVGEKGTYLTDATAGKKIAVGTKVSNRRIIVSAISDTRGLKANKESQVLVSGSYSIK